MPPGAIVGVIGPNGAGKTTLFRMIVGQEQPDAGSLTVGSTVKLAYVDQSRDTLDGSKTVWEEIFPAATSRSVGQPADQLARLCGALQLCRQDQQKKVNMLSGGERNRVHLAKMLKSGGQRDPAGRTDQRPRREHAARAGRGAGEALPAAPWSSPTTAGSWTALPPTSWPSRATARSSGSPATTANTRKTAIAASGQSPIGHTASPTAS
jgi:hypothetical protein